MTTASLAAALAETDPARALPLFAQAADAGADGALFWKSFGFHALNVGSPHAAVLLERALSWAPQDAEIIAGLGAAAEDSGQTEQAATLYQAALALNPQLGPAAMNLGLIEMRRRDYPAAANAFEAALAAGNLDATAARAHLLACCFMGADRSVARTQAMTSDWVRDVAAAVIPGRPTPRPGLARRPLRVGVVAESPSNAHFRLTLRPLLAGLARQNAEVIFYARRNGADLAAQYQDLGVALRDLSDLDAASAAAAIAQDQQDLLVSADCLVMGGDAAFYAARPAPLQIQMSHAFFTYGGALFDALAMDATSYPPGLDDAYAETLIRTSAVGLYDAAILADRPPLRPPPLTEGRPPCFGSFNRPNKIDAATLDFWSAALAAVPEATLFLSSGDYDDAALRDRLTARLTAAGIHPARVRFRGATWPAAAFYAGYDQIDVALDCVSFSGGLTTLDALLQGVPVITAPTPHPLGRLSAAMLESVGLTACCVAVSAADGAAKAAALIADPAGLTALRAELRDRCLASPLFDADLFAASLLSPCRAWLLARHPAAA